MPATGPLRPFQTALILSIFQASILNITPVAAQLPQPPPTPVPDPSAPAAQPEQPAEPPEEKAAWIRVWFMAKPAAPVEVRFQNAGDGAEPAVLLSEPPPFYLVTGYRDLPAASGTLSIITRGPQPRPLASTPATLREAGFYTAIVRAEGSGYRIELIDDSLERRPPPDPANPQIKPKPLRLPPQLRIYHFTEGLPVQVRVPASNFSAPLEFGGRAVLENPAFLALPIEITYPGPDGQPVTASTEADLRQTPSCSLVLVRDPYGRFSPRIVANGRLE